ncbi:MAG: hypothetical protein J0H64_04425, partial [Actinobacteria bacterium]|nr:hypothetical protein [Actinomycetota bacterium]
MSDFTHAPPGADTAGSDAVEEPAEAPVAERNDTRPDGGPERLAPRLGNGSERPALRLGFARGVAPSKWARRWAESGAVPLELIPLPASGRRIDGLDVVLERVAPGAQPEGTGAQPEGASAQPEGTGAQPEGTEDGGAEGNRTGNDRAEGDGAERHAVRLYSESIALVVAADHELAGEESVDLDALQLVKLLAHPDHAPQWPEPEAWKDPSWAPADAAAALELVATGLGAILLPLPLARHL